MIINLIINGLVKKIDIDASEILLDVLRNRLGLMGTKENCRQGECGACTVLIDGKAINSCLVLAYTLEGSEIVTIEGLSSGESLHPIQEAFMEKDGLQCGFCTPGMIMSTKALLDKNNTPTENEIKIALAGNLCRCTGYKNIIKSVIEASKKITKESL